jgi:hypothetical protein
MSRERGPHGDGDEYRPSIAVVTAHHGERACAEIRVDTGVLEFHNNRVAYPFTDTLYGLQFMNGLPGSVSAP